MTKAGELKRYDGIDDGQCYTFPTTDHEAVELGFAVTPGTGALRIAFGVIAGESVMFVERQAGKGWTECAPRVVGGLEVERWMNRLESVGSPFAEQAASTLSELEDGESEHDGLDAAERAYEASQEAAAAKKPAAKKPAAKKPAARKPAARKQPAAKKQPAAARKQPSAAKQPAAKTKAKR